jgi:ribosome-associated protein
MTPPAPSDALRVDDRVSIPASDLSWKAVRASGPGGQNVNQVATKVDLRFDLEGTQALSDRVKNRLRTLAAHRLDADGRIQITCQQTRTQLGNLELARETLADLVRAALIEPKRRRPTRPTKGSKRRRLEGKRRRGDIKSSRGKVSGND